MDLLKNTTAALIALFILTGCQAGYLIENGYYQAKLLLNRVPNAEAIKDENLTDEQKRKIRLAEEATVFAESKLGLKPSANYRKFVDLGRPYVVHSLTVAKKNELKPYKWWFPFFGSFPYLGYYNKDSALKAQKRFIANDYDTYVRGVTAFSSLGWFDDPILSSMLRYTDYDLVNVIIHETVHATVYIKDAVEFNERLAVFVGNIGTERFYQAKEGKDSQTLKQAAMSSNDDREFSKFITAELDSLDKWYKEQKAPIDEDLRQKRFQEIRDNFTTKLKPKLQTKGYDWFVKAKLNNARLMNFRTYFKDLSDFEKVYENLGKDFKKLIDFCISLEKAEDPEKALARAAAIQANEK